MWTLYIVLEEFLLLVKHKNPILQMLNSTKKAQKLLERLIHHDQLFAEVENEA